MGAQQPPAKSVLVISVNPRGFEPSRVEIRRGEFLLAIHDRTGLDEVDLRVERATGAVLAAVRIPRQIAQWHSLTDFPVGAYRIRELSHPEWSCEIVVVP